MCAATICAAEVRPVNGCAPVNSSYAMTPHAYKSARRSTTKRSYVMIAKFMQGGEKLDDAIKRVENELEAMLVSEQAVDVSPKRSANRMRTRSVQ